MGKVYEQIDGALEEFIRAQRMFFVATGPLSASGHINLSPKGLDTLRILDPHTVAYLDYVGSGAETIAHLRENGRIVVMLCAFEGPPRIVRLYGRGEVLEPHDREFDRLRTLFQAEPAGRAIVRISIARIADSCGYGVPLYSFEGHRPQLQAWASRKGTQGLLDYQQDTNRLSIDGLPALRWPETNTSKSGRDAAEPGVGQTKPETQSLDALIIVDMQVASFADGKKHDVAGVVGRINLLSNVVRSAGGTVVFVQHDGTEGEGLLPNTPGWQVLPALDVQPGDLFIRKAMNDAFAGTRLNEELLRVSARTLGVTGWATDYCVDSTIRSAVSRGFRVVAPSDAHTVSDRAHLTARQIVDHHNRTWAGLIADRPVHVARTEELLARW